VHNALTSAGQTIQEKGGTLLQGALSSAASLLNIAMFFVVVPVVSFYLLLDWDNMIAKIDDLLPRDHAPVVRKIFNDIDATLASFVRGQGTVCLILGAYYAISLMIVGLNFGLVVGFIAGIVSFIPYVGAIVGGVLSIGLALFQFWGDWWMIAAVFAVFQVGQILEGNVLTPMLIGNSVGLHPVWLILALSVFGSIFGFIGLLVAVPLAASLGVVIRYIAAQYKDSRLYRGLTGRDAP
jgi:predicted PurR-regulated permease PerM